ncbi:type II toxin-antitoxin system VapC family toxin [Halobellus ordinarius]|uniref:type II toxin-antitoxin system VapC family toxin n=1 Tax=Halobellus ordinarius TaxID=3075120 RepID=UPI0028808C8E|nr:type II toxin-antitoxin system VapC family toxin [Halobellus sp. ZY16]
MTVLVDTGVLYADHDTDATRHESAAAALEAVYDGEMGHPYISDYVFDEAITLARRRTGSFASAKQLSDRLRGAGAFPAVFEMIRVSAAVFDDAVTIFERYDDQRLSFTDATTIALAERHGIDRVLSFDDDFDGIVRRTDPSGI